MVLSLLYGKRYNSPKVGSIELDVTLREDHKYRSRVTQYPIEDGTELSDHIINEPTVVHLEAIVSDSPLNILSSFNRSISKFNDLIDLHRRRSVITLVTGLKTYQNMVITSLDIPRSTTTGQSLTFNIELQQIILDATVIQTQNQQNLFGGVQSVISREIVSTGENIPLIKFDPANSLKDQAQSSVSFGVQQLQDIPPDILPKVEESLAIIQGVA